MLREWEYFSSEQWSVRQTPPHQHMPKKSNIVFEVAQGLVYSVTSLRLSVVVNATR
jgi:hypothetical protein